MTEVIGWVLFSSFIWLPVGTLAVQAGYTRLGPVSEDVKLAIALIQEAKSNDVKRELRERWDIEISQAGEDLKLYFLGVSIPLRVSDKYALNKALETYKDKKFSVKRREVSQTIAERVLNA